MTGAGAILNQLNLVVRDMDATLAFYRRLGLEIDAPPGADHVAVHLAGILLEFDSSEFAPQWDSGYSGDAGSGSVVIGFGLPSRDAVDATYAALLDAGGRARQPPYDAFWGARYAIVADPDARAVGLMSPVERERRFWPPRRPPR